MESFASVLNLVKQYISKEISDVNYKLWIAPLEPVRYEDGNVYLFIKDDFLKMVLDKNYTDILTRTFSQVMGGDVQIHILTKGDLKLDNFPYMPESPTSELEDDPGMKQELERYFRGAEYDYTFQTFIVGNSNNFAYAACNAVAKRQSGAYNPLFIYGPSGLGKTHLLMAISNEIKKNSPKTNIIYINGEGFANEFITAIGNETTDLFHDKFRKADILLVDDIQFIAGKERTQEEFFYTFNELHQVGKQIVLTSDRPPKDIKTLEDRLRTRFEWGLLTDISTPDFETRIAIIRRKAELLELQIPDDVAEYIANRLKTNIRQLEGAVKKLKALKLLAGTPPSVAMAQNVISDILNDNQPIPVTVERIITEIARTYGVSPTDIRSSKRSAPISTARQISIYVVREITQMSLSAIGKEFGGRDHSTIVYAISQVEKLMKKDTKAKETIEDIIKNIRDS
ncbi:MAG TPA: chromosomal replication initiator protein DnaA [Oscillospiraceae bacterium]|nr:chromosomal replication initiator protein DnaA [Oscillospiraceae bacterium]